MREHRLTQEKNAITFFASTKKKMAFYRLIQGVVALSIIAPCAIAGAGDTCSITLSGIAFTKCLNNAEKIQLLMMV
ncbi:hypothetical protein [Cellvibrio sp. UBA7661]|uniref:hypothetical protein n=1 Tax=Cellvibrio sp. UBA7661 TaxID=1946311 RepID=UPI002F35AA0F